MRSARQVLTLSMGVAGLFFLPAFQGFAESIYHWKDRNGISCYSNATIPVEATEYLVIYTTAPEAGKAEGSGVTGDMETDGGGMPDPDGSDMVPGSRAAILRDRIEQRQTSIHSIEKLLKTHPNDASLRRRLYEKKQCLQEDIIRLKLLTN